MYSFLVTATYQYYDGILWSELIDKVASDTGIKARVLRVFGRNKGKEGTSEESFIDVKSLQNSQHKQYRLFALKFYLSMLFVHKYTTVLCFMIMVKIFGSMKK